MTLKKCEKDCSQSPKQQRTKQAGSFLISGTTEPDVISSCSGISSHDVTNVTL